MIDNEVKRLYEGFDVVTKSLAFKKNLSEYFDVLVMDKVITSNPIKQVASKILNQNKEYLQVRNALVVRHFDSKQLQDIYKAGLNLYKRGEKRGLAIIIKLFTGLETNVVCALQWKDLKKITTFENDEFYQLIIRRKATFDGNTISGMDKKEKYRYIPVPETLTQLLVKEKERQKEKYNTLSENALNERAIIDGGKHVVMGSVSIYSPSQLNEIFRRILCKYIEKNEIILPTSKEQERKLDLNSYGGDMFKSNFRHYGLTIASFENCEIDYLLGNKQDITFARNYCDYSNDASQLILKCKIERYLTLFQDEESELAMLSIDRGSNYTTTRDAQKLTEVNMVIHALADAKIEIETKYGYRAKVVPIKGK